MCAVWVKTDTYLSILLKSKIMLVQPSLQNFTMLIHCLTDFLVKRQKTKKKEIKFAIYANAEIIFKHRHGIMTRVIRFKAIVAISNTLRYYSALITRHDRTRKKGEKVWKEEDSLMRERIQKMILYAHSL